MNKIHKKQIVKDLSRFIKYNSVCTGSNLAFAKEVGRFLKRGGLRVSYQTTRRNGQSFANVLGMKGKGTRPLLLCSHLDTVPPGNLKDWTKTHKNPWAPARSNGRLYGLGSADDKGPLLAMLYAASHFPENRLKRPLLVMGTFGEENGMGGARLFIEKWKKGKPFDFAQGKPCAVIAGEPTDLTVTYRHKGIGAVVIELVSMSSAGLNLRYGSSGVRKVRYEFKGKQGHSSRPAVGINALDKAIRFLKAFSRSGTAESYVVLNLNGGSAANIIPASASLEILKLQRGRFHKGGLTLKQTIPVFPSHAVLDCFNSVQSLVNPLKKKRDPHIDPPTITSTFGVARTSGNILALTFDFRLLPGQEFKKIYSRLVKELRKKLKLYPGLKWKVTVDRDNLPLGLDRKHPLVQLSQSLLKKLGLPPTLKANPGCTEAGTYHAWGSPAIVFGPGKAYGNIHSPNESIEISQIQKAVDFYTLAIETLCS
jgi:acetylornithine deacetylase/succinyl-diaminopimelate desuccinylase-like protein